MASLVAKQDTHVMSGMGLRDDDVAQDGDDDV